MFINADELNERWLGMFNRVKVAKMVKDGTLRLMVMGKTNLYVMRDVARFEGTYEYNQAYGERAARERDFCYNNNVFESPREFNARINKKEPHQGW